VTFREPLFLLGLLLVPLALLAYLRAERARRAAAAVQLAPALQPAVAPWRPGWRRHAPPAAYALALGALLVALARPEATVAVPVERASIMLVTDHSGSMQATDVAPDRLTAARAAAEGFLARVPARIRVGLVAFDHRARTLASPTTDRAAVREALASLRPSGGTATGDALAAALTALERTTRAGGRPAPAAIVLVSDGTSTRGRDPVEVARRARRLGVPVATVAFGTPQGTIDVRTSSGAVERRRVPPDAASLRAVADASGGRAYAAADAEALSAVYEELGSRVARRDERREVTAAFAGGALALLLGGAALSLHWFRRLP
jgi:Ca-activated chloride channel family protein